MEIFSLTTLIRFAICFIFPIFVSIFRGLNKISALKRILLSIALFIPLCLQAQDTFNPSLIGASEHHEIGLMVGVANYYGDLQQKLFPSYGYQPMAGIMYKYFMSPHVGLRFGASYTNLTAADSMSNIPVDKARNLSFATHLFEFQGGVEINFLPIEVMRHKATPYIFGGIAAFYTNPYAIDPEGNKVYLRPLSTEGEGLPSYPNRKQYSLVNMALPFGGGFKFFIGKTIMLTTEIGFRYTNTSHIDDVGSSYVNLDTLQKYKGTIARQMSYRGNELPSWDGVNPTYGNQRGDNTNDWYWYGNLTVTIFFRSFGNPKEYLKTKCPGFFR